MKFFQKAPVAAASIGSDMSTSRSSKPYFENIPENDRSATNTGRCPRSRQACAMPTQFSAGPNAASGKNTIVFTRVWPLGWNGYAFFIAVDVTKTKVVPTRHVAILRARRYVGVRIEGSDIRLQVEMGEEAGLVRSPEGRVPGIKAGRDAEANAARCDIRCHQVDEQI